MYDTIKKKFVVTVTPRTICSITTTVFSTYICLGETDVREDGSKVITLPRTHLCIDDTSTIEVGSTCNYVSVVEHRLDDHGVSTQELPVVTAHVSSGMQVLQCMFSLGEPVCELPVVHVCDENTIREEVEFSAKYGWLYDQSSDLTKHHLCDKYCHGTLMMGKMLEDIHNYKMELSKTTAIVPYVYHPLDNVISGDTHKEFTLFVEGDVEHKLLAFLDTVMSVVSGKG